MANDLSASAWIAKQPGLDVAARQWLDDLPTLLQSANRRARRLTSPSLASQPFARLGRLASQAAPSVLPALLARDGEATVKAIAAAALKGGPTYVKLGQLISSTRGLVPDWIADAFAGCRDAVPPAPAASIERVLERSGIDARLRTWDRVPLASASVAQVHAATLDDGTDVVVKVRRPGVISTVSADASYLLPALFVAELGNDRMRMANLRGTFELMVTLFAQEVDLRLEAANIVEMALALERAGLDVEVPAPIPSLVTKRALVMQRVDGVSTAETDAMARYGHAGGELLRLAIVTVLATALKDGIFHGDLHAGNVFVTEKGLALLDFGIVGRLSPVQRQALVRLLAAGMAEDQSEVLEALKDFGALPRDADVTRLVELLPDPPTMDERRAFMADPSLMEDRVTQIVRALGASGFRVPAELTLFAKNALYLNDAVLRHGADFDVVDEVMTAMLSVLPPG